MASTEIGPPELDHAFIATTAPALVERTLTDFGLRFSVRRTHHGQGTANACAMFDNAYLEILWPTDDAELLSERVKPLGLWERAHWPQTGACPFGISLRLPKGRTLPPSIRSWIYEPLHRSGSEGLPIVTPRGACGEPLIFITPGGQPPVRWPAAAGLDLQQCQKRRSLTGLRLYRPRGSAPLSESVQRLCETQFISIDEGSTHRLELEWDGGGEGQCHAFAAPLPITIRW